MGRAYQPGDLSRGAPLPPYRSPSNKTLSDDDAQQILDARPEWDGKGYGNAELKRQLAKKFGTSVSSVDRIWQRRSFRHLERNRSE